MTNMLDFWTHVSTIDWVRNFHRAWWLPRWIESPIISEYTDALSRIVKETTTLWGLEARLREEFWTDIIEVDWSRLACTIAVSGTQIRRKAERIILPNGETAMPTQTNMGWDVVDPIWWSSKVIAPSEWYGFLGKILELRTHHDNDRFDEKTHSKIMNTQVALKDKWFAFEIWDKESVIMPAYSIEGVRELVQRYSEPMRKWDIQTSKHYAINS